MSRSWERKVRRNSAQINATRKKRGQTVIQTGSTKSEGPIERFKGRTYIAPILLLAFITLYSVILPATTQSGTGWNWTMLVIYIFLALMMFMRRPYLLVGQDYVQTRRMTGDRRLSKENIKSITVQKSYVAIEQIKGPSWMFSRVMNLYPVEQMGASLEQFAERNKIPFTRK